MRKILYNKLLYLRVVILPDSILVSYTGTYQLSPGNVIVVTKVGGQLKASAREYGTLDIFPASDRYFFPKVIDVDLEFVKDKYGRTATLAIDLECRRLEAKKIN